MSDQLTLRFDFAFEDLYRREGLLRLDAVFLEHLHAANGDLRTRLVKARLNAEPLTRKQQSDLIIDIAPYVEDFVGELFGIESAVKNLQARHDKLAPIYACKRKFIQKKAISGVTKE